jgi:DNA-binding MarR family transcriptional regulator
MNEHEEKRVDAYRSFLLINEIDKEEPLTQRELSRRLGIALGLVNSYIKNLVAKGYVRISEFPRNRYSYLLTTRGIAEKSRLAFQHLSYFTNLYKITRKDYLELFRSLQAAGVASVTFCGLDEVAEIAYLSLRETGIKLAAVMDNEHGAKKFFDNEVAPLPSGFEGGDGIIVITSLKRGGQLIDELVRRGVGRERIFCAGTKPIIPEESREGS